MILSRIDAGEHGIVENLLRDSQQEQVALVIMDF
jgi:hypothetical protein